MPAPIAREGKFAPRPIVQPGARGQDETEVSMQVGGVPASTGACAKASAPTPRANRRPVACGSGRGALLGAALDVAGGDVFHRHQRGVDPLGNYVFVDHDLTDVIA